MIVSEDHPLVRAWLRRFDAASAGLPETRRAELRAEVAAHLHEATSPEMPDGAVRDVLDELGDPAAIVREESAEIPSTRHVAWIVGGVLIVLSAVVPWATRSSGIDPLPFTDLAWIAGVLVLVLGRPSITAHRPLGTAAVVGLVVWTLGWGIANRLVAQATAGVGGDTTPLLVGSYIDQAGRLLLAIVAVVQIGRIEAVRRPWRWVPAWVLGVVAGAWMLETLVALIAGAASGPFLQLGLSGIATTGGTLVLGIVAIGLGAGVLRQQGGTPPVDDVD